MNTKQALALLDTLSTALISITVFLLPLFFLTSSTDLITIPKQLLIIFASGALLFLWGIKIIIDRRLVLNANPLSIPLLIFLLVVILSAVLSRNRFDSVIQTVPVLFAVIFFFIIVNSIREKKSFLIALSSVVLGAAVSLIITILSFFNLYILPFANTQNQFFNTLGSSIQQIVYSAPILVLIIFNLARKFGFPKIKVSLSHLGNYEVFINSFASIAIISGLLVILYQIIALPNKPILLPYIYGFQTAAATITQDAQRFILSLLFGSGYGTFATDFTRFKLPSFNLEQNIWNLTFSFSSSYFLEIIATTGILGAISYLGVIFSILKLRMTKNPLFIGLFVIIVLSFILPFNFAVIALLLILAGMYISYLNILGDKRVYDTSMSLISTKSGGLSLETHQGEYQGRSHSPLLPALVFLIILLFIGLSGFFTLKFAMADFKFSESLKQANLNNGQRTYELQSQALRDFPYKADYHRIFSQVNLALANSLATGVPPGSSPSAEVQRNITILLQQSINSGRNAVILAPLTTLAWQNLSQVYRSLINVGQDAERFAIGSIGQAIAVDPYNPILYIQRGGIFYQLKQWDNAQNQFQIAINLKRDFANAYYNLGHALEEKGDLSDALRAYQAVKQLSAGNKTNLDKINQEISALEAKIGQAKSQGTQIQPETEQTPLSISEPSANLPPQNPPIKISPPPAGEDEDATESAQ